MTKNSAEEEKMSLPMKKKVFLIAEVSVTNRQEKLKKNFCFHLKIAHPFQYSDERIRLFMASASKDAAAGWAERGRQRPPGRNERKEMR